ncbi:hypothetical protein J7L01_07155, partial [bacterium]|nr:hypothetical protein [bacterium]
MENRLRISIRVFLIGIVFCLLIVNCSKKGSENNPSAMIITLSPIFGPPATIIDIESSAVLNENTYIYFDTVKSAIIPYTSPNSYQTIAPFLAPGSYNVELRLEDNDSVIASSLFEITDDTISITTPGEVTTNVIRDFSSVLSSVKDSIFYTLYVQDVLTEDEYTVIETAANRHINAINIICANVSSLPDSDKLLLDKAIISCGLRDIIANSQKGNLYFNNTDSEEYIVHHSLVALDLTSSLLTLASRFTLLLTFFSAIVTGPGAAIPAELTLFIKGFDTI